MRAALTVFFGMLMLAACVRNKDTHALAEQFVCPMHPSVVQDYPGQCPVCGMDLVKRGATAGMEEALFLTPEAIRLANLSTVPVRRQAMEQAWLTTGTLQPDETLRKEVSARAGGRLEKLLIRETGQMVREGQPLYVLYSETLLALEEEYLATLKDAASGSLLSGLAEHARKKLLHFGLTDRQIEALAMRKEAGASVVFLAPVSGRVTGVLATEGMYVEEGQILYQLDQLDHLWAEADVFASEVSLVQRGAPVEVRLSDGVWMPSRIDYISPSFVRGQQVLRVRAGLRVQGGQVPGTQVEMRFPRTLPLALVVPSESIVREGGGTLVWTAGSDGHFRPRQVRLGNEAGGFTAIQAGLEEGEQVVTTGAFLLTGEWTLKNGNDLPQMKEYIEKQ